MFHHQSSTYHPITLRFSIPYFSPHVSCPPYNSHDPVLSHPHSSPYVSNSPCFPHGISFPTHNYHDPLLSVPPALSYLVSLLITLHLQCLLTGRVLRRYPEVPGGGRHDAGPHERGVAEYGGQLCGSAATRARPGVQDLTPQVTTLFMRRKPTETKTMHD